MSNPEFEEEQSQKWQSLLRGQIINSTSYKFSRLLHLLDQKAQVMILLNSFLVPVCIAGLQDPTYHYPAMISIATSCLSILASMVAIYPKRGRRKLGKKNMNFLHFNDIGPLHQHEFMEAFMPIFNDLNRLAEESVKDLHDISRNAIIPKYFWVKASYMAFSIGNMAALCLLGILVQMNIDF